MESKWFRKSVNSMFVLMVLICMFPIQIDANKDSCVLKPNFNEMKNKNLNA